MRNALPVAKSLYAVVGDSLMRGVDDSGGQLLDVPESLRAQQHRGCARVHAANRRAGGVRGILRAQRPAMRPRHGRHALCRPARMLPYVTEARRAMWSASARSKCCPRFSSCRIATADPARQEAGRARSRHAAQLYGLRRRVRRFLVPLPTASRRTAMRVLSRGSRAARCPTAGVAALGRGAHRGSCAGRVPGSVRFRRDGRRRGLDLQAVAGPLAAPVKWSRAIRWSASK